MAVQLRQQWPLSSKYDCERIQTAALPEGRAAQRLAGRTGWRWELVLVVGSYYPNIERSERKHATLDPQR